MPNEQDKEQLCQCGHPYKIHLEPSYSETMCTDPDCKCKRFTPKPSINEQEIKELDKMVELIEPTIKKYKAYLKDNPKIDYRNFAAHEIAESLYNSGYRNVNNIKLTANTYICKEDCQNCSPDGCYIDDQMYNPEGLLSFEKVGEYPICFMYKPPHKSIENTSARQGQDKVEQPYWMRSGRHG